MPLNKYPYDVIGAHEKKIAPGPAHSLGGPAYIIRQPVFLIFNFTSPLWVFPKWTGKRIECWITFDWMVKQQVHLIRIVFNYRSYFGSLAFLLPEKRSEVVSKRRVKAGYLKTQISKHFKKPTKAFLQKVYIEKHVKFRRDWWIQI